MVMVGADDFAAGLFFCATTGVAIVQTAINQNQMERDDEAIDLLDRTERLTTQPMDQ
jgi:hypothetical protein